MHKAPMKIAIFACVACSCCFGWLLRGYFDDHARHSSETEIRQRGYVFTKPLLECEQTSSGVGDRELMPFQRKVGDAIGKLENGTSIQTISVYFRDLDNGPWFGINLDARFSPASLLKVPVMIACFLEAEADRNFLKKRIRYIGGNDANEGEHFKPSEPIITGREYSIDDLIRRTIIYSDNNANNQLLEHLNMDLLYKAYRDMGITMSGDVDKEDFMTIKEYASFFRVLFNASYLSKEMSEKALSYLSEAAFKDGLVAGVPSNIRIAHKFGERVLGANGTIKQLHDCGIVYYPEKPYLLCVMTRGNSFEYLDDAIRDISRLVYQEVDRQRGNASAFSGAIQ